MTHGFFPRVVRFDSTWRCNLRCSHCQTGLFRDDDHPEDLPLARLFRLVDEMTELGTEEVVFLGGEPLMMGGVTEVIRRLADRGVKTTVVTNGLLLKVWAHRLIDAGATTVTVSLDGASPETHDHLRGRGTFRSALRGFAAMKSAIASSPGCRTTLGVSSVLSRGSIHEAARLIDLADEIGADYLIVAAVNAVGFAIDNWDDLALTDLQVRQAAVELANRMAQGMLCGVRVNFFTPALQRYLREDLGYQDILTTPYLDEGSLFECYVQSDGRVFPSQKISEIHPVSLRRARDFGISFQHNDLLTASLSDIWSGGEFERYRALILRNEHIRGYETCSSCVFSRSFCRPSPVSYLLGDSVPKSICTTVPLSEVS